jgi:Skp family chaperone for outer membrane proteins
MRLTIVLAASLAACAGGDASAQTFGPPIPGLCLFSRTTAISASLAGQSLQTQVREMQGSLSGNLAAQRQSLEQQRRALEGSQASIAPIDYQRQQNELAQRMKMLEEQQNARFVAAQQQGQQQIDRALNEALGRVVTQTACSVVLERDNAYGWNNAMDITTAVTKAMDAITQQVRVQ